MKTADIEEIQSVLREAELLCSVERVKAALDHMAMEINAGLGDRNPLLLVVMNGGLIPAARLFTRLDFPFQVDYLHATRYRSGTQGGAIQWIAWPRISLEGRVVLVIDDIFDEGHTLKAILEKLRQSGAREVYSAVLANKIHNRKEPGLTVDFIGLEVEDRYVFGCGMDYKEYLRNLPAIHALRETNAIS